MITSNIDGFLKSGYDSSYVGFLESESINYQLHVENIAQAGHGFVGLPDHTEEAIQIQAYVDSIKNRYEHIVLIGIGGSALGPKCLLQSLGNHSELHVEVLENLDPAEIKRVEESVVLEKTIFLVISKSGNTPETVVEYLYFRQKIIDLNLRLDNHFLFITDPNSGYLRKQGSILGVKTFDLPPKVGGRYSVLSSVGLVFGAFLGLDLVKLLSGARNYRDKFFELSNFEQNEAFNLSLIQYFLYQNGHNITVMMPYSSRLKSLSEWYVQLLSESIGKADNRDGEKVNVGITPVSALGVTDQHSLLQLLQDGPKDKLVVFIELAEHGHYLYIPEPEADQLDLKYLSGKSINQLFSAELEGTRQSLVEAGKPNISLKIDKLDEESLGELFMLLELSVAVLGELFNVDAFDQPGVERSKVLSKENLAKMK